MRLVHKLVVASDAAVEVNAAVVYGPAGRRPAGAADRQGPAAGDRDATLPTGMSTVSVPGRSDVRALVDHDDRAGG